jgi:DNA-binding FrmR family transcriptional regulator
MSKPANPEENLEDRRDWRLCQQHKRLIRRQLWLGWALQLSRITAAPAVRWLNQESKTMKIQDQDAKEKLIQRLRRIEGQVRGVQAMLEAERDCRDIMQQLAAVHSAVQGASRFFLQEYATACLAELDDGKSAETGLDRRKKREQIVQDMIALLDKAP